MNLEKPKKAEYILLYFVSFTILGNILSLYNGEYFWSSSGQYLDPYFDYNDNLGIVIISIITFFINFFIFSNIIYMRFGNHKFASIKVNILLCLIGSILIFVELWYGSTFYYGEVRDKQGLPFGINNFGLLGSYIFLLYIASRINLPTNLQAYRGLYLGISSLLIFLFLFVLYKIVYVPWNLFQS